MQTSALARSTVLLVLFSAAVVIAYFNIRLVYFTLRRRKVKPIVRAVWHALGLLLVLAIVDAFWIEPNWIEVTHHVIGTDKLRPGTRLRIVHISDIHMEEFGPREKEALKLTRMARPDLILLTGDYRHFTTRSPVKELTRLAGELARMAPSYAVEGSVDSYDDMQALRKAGVRLIHSWVMVRGRRRQRVALGRLGVWVPKVDPCPAELRPYFGIMLSHTPYQFDDAAAAGVELFLAGHTHGGQVRLPVIGALLPDTMVVGRYQAGLYGNGAGRLYVSRGIGLEGGIAPRVRFFCRPEVAVIDIVGRNRPPRPMSNQ